MRNLIIIIYFISVLPWQHARAIDDTERQGIINQNLLDPWNGGFENGLRDWSVTGGETLSLATNAGTYLVGKASGVWDASATSKVLASKAVTLPLGVYGQNGAAQCLIKVTSGTAAHTLSVYDGTNTLVSSTINSSTTGAYTTVNFIFPSSGTIQIKITSTQNEPEITVDDCYIGKAANITNVSQATFIGSARIAGTASCRPVRTNTAIGAFSTVAACPGPTVISNPGPGTIQTTDADLPRFTVNSLPPGTYRVVMNFEAFSSATGSGMAFSIYDGTTTYPAQEGTSTSSANGTNNFSIEGIFTYTSTANVTFELYGANTSGTVTVENSLTNDNISFSIFRYPSTSEQAFRPDVGPSHWSGYHGSDCGNWLRTNTAYGDPGTDASCTLYEVVNRNFGTVSSYNGASALPGLVWTPTRTGDYLVCANLSVSINTASAVGSLKLYDGTTTIFERDSQVTAANGNAISGCGIYRATSTSAVSMRFETKAGAGQIAINSLGQARGAIEWSITALDYSMNAPVLVGSVTQPSSGAERYIRCSFNWAAGAPTELTDPAGVCSGYADNTTGDTTITIAASTFSATPFCLCSVNNNTATQNTTQNRECRFISLSSTSMRVLVADGTSTAVDEDDGVNIMCWGAR